MNSDLSHLDSIFPFLLESIFISSSLAVILIDWNHSFLEMSLLRLIQSYLPRWRNRNIRQDVYICLVLTALAIMYSNSMKNFAINMENCRIAVVSFVVLLSFWLQSKPKADNVTDKCVGTQRVPVSNKSVGGSSVMHRDQTTSASTCCRAGIPRHLLSLSCSSSEPQSEVNMEQELRRSYVEAFRTQFDEEEVTHEELITAIQYLNTIKGGIAAHRSAEKLIDAVDHIHRMGQRSRLDDSGLPQDYTYEELHQIVVEESGYPLEDFERVVEKCLENSSFLPSPEEFVEIHHDMKVQLEREVAETKREMEETLRVVEETTQEVVESRQKVVSLRERLQQRERIILQRDQTLQQKDQALEQHQQALQQKDQTLQQNQQALQQRDQALQQKDRIIQQERQRIRMLEERSQQLPEGEWQRRLRELEEENRRLSAQSDRSKCKICRVEEVQVFFTPCNHLISCHSCVESLPEKLCPMCRQPIQGTVTMFFA